MDNKLYVGNLSFGTTNEDLELLFAQAGAVKSVNLIKDRESGRSRGFAFVEMGSEEAAQEAISQFHGIHYQGRQITVNIARPREDRPPRGDGGGGDRPYRRYDGGGGGGGGGDRGGRGTGGADRGGDRGGERRGNRFGSSYSDEESEGRRRNW